MANTAALQAAGWKVVKSNVDGVYIYEVLIDGHQSQQISTTLAGIESACTGHRDQRTAHSNKTGSEVN